MKQSEAFLQFAGDWWHDHNPHGNENDPVLRVIGQMGYPFKAFLEIGCGTGWRLQKLRKDALAWGIEPSEKASSLDDGIIRGTAENLPFKNDIFDCVIFGFCLAWVDPDDYFKVASESNRVLQDGGFLIIHDFLPARPLMRHYLTTENAKKENDFTVFFHLMDFSKIWLSHPYFQLEFEVHNFREEQAVIVLRKQVQTAFPMIEVEPPKIYKL